MFGNGVVERSWGSIEVLMTVFSFHESGEY